MAKSAKGTQKASHAVSPLAPNTVYFTAGINGQKDGLFGDIVASPEPRPLALAALGCLAVWLFARRLRAPITRI